MYVTGAFVMCELGRCTRDQHIVRLDACRFMIVLLVVSMNFFLILLLGVCYLLLLLSSLSLLFVLLHPVVVFD